MNYMRLEQGRNDVVISCEFPFIRKIVHWVIDPLNSACLKRACVGPIYFCQYCHANNRPSARWTLNVTDQGDNENKLLEIGASIMRQIEQIYERYGTVIGKRIVIHRDAPSFTYRVREFLT